MHATRLVTWDDFRLHSMKLKEAIYQQLNHNLQFHIDRAVNISTATTVATGPGYLGSLWGPFQERLRCSCPLRMQPPDVSVTG